MDLKKLIVGSLAIGTVAYFLKNQSKSKIKQNIIKDFDIEKFLGTWYEIARLDFIFEKNKINCEAYYSLTDNGLIEVINRGFDTISNQWKTSVGKAKQVVTNTGELQVSFFRPFYSPYNVIEVIGDYETILVAGKNYDYLWILSRDQEIKEDVKKSLLRKAQEIGFDIDKLLWTANLPM